MVSQGPSAEDRRNDEARHRPTGPGWSEWHRLLVLGDGGVPALAMTVGIETPQDRDAASSQPAGPSQYAASSQPAAPSQYAASFQCAVFEDGRPPVVIAEDNIPAPDDRWELRTSGLWTDNICETPHRHWSYGLEAFALEIDDPGELLGRGYGRRVPLGWELEFESGPDRVVRWPMVAGGAYGQAGRVDGVLLFAGRSTPLTGDAVRQHWWGPTAAAPLELLDHQAELGRRPDRPHRSGAVAPDGIGIGIGNGDRAAGGRVAAAVGLPLSSGVWWLDAGLGWLVSRTDPPAAGGLGPQR